MCSPFLYPSLFKISAQISNTVLTLVHETTFSHLDYSNILTDITDNSLAPSHIISPFPIFQLQWYLRKQIECRITFWSTNECIYTVSEQGQILYLFAVVSFIILELWSSAQTTNQLRK